MSLFDVIRYPISDPPTWDEISALPDDIITYILIDLFNVGHTFLARSDIKSTAAHLYFGNEHIKSRMHSSAKNGNRYKENLTKLRKYIQDYESL